MGKRGTEERVANEQKKKEKKRKEQRSLRFSFPPLAFFYEYKQNKTKQQQKQKQKRRHVLRPREREPDGRRAVHGRRAPPDDLRGPVVEHDDDRLRRADAREEAEQARGRVARDRVDVGVEPVDLK